MEITLTPEQEEQLTDLAAKSGRSPSDMAQDAIAAYLSDLAEVREMLDSRYDDVESGKVKLIPGEEIEAYFREKSEAARRARSGS